MVGINAVKEHLRSIEDSYDSVGRCWYLSLSALLLASHESPNPLLAFLQAHRLSSVIDLTQLEGIVFEWR